MSSESTTLAVRSPSGWLTTRRRRRSINWCAPWPRWAEGLICHAQNDFPGHLAGVQQLVRGPGLLDGELGADDRAHLAVADHRPDVGDNLGDDLAFAARATDRTRPQCRGDHAGALAEQLADVEFGFDAALQPDDYQSSAGGESVDVTVEVFGAHDVEDHVGATFAAHALHEVLVAVIDGDLGAQFGAEVEFVPRPGGDGHPRAERACHLDAVRADAAGAAVDQQELTGRQMRGHH